MVRQWMPCSQTQIMNAGTLSGWSIRVDPSSPLDARLLWTVGELVLIELHHWKPEETLALFRCSHITREVQHTSVNWRHCWPIRQILRRQDRRSSTRHSSCTDTNLHCPQQARLPAFPRDLWKGSDGSAYAIASQELSTWSATNVRPSWECRPHFPIHLGHLQCLAAKLSVYPVCRRELLWRQSWRSPMPIQMNRKTINWSQAWHFCQKLSNVW